MDRTCGAEKAWTCFGQEIERKVMSARDVDEDDRRQDGRR